MHNSSRQTLYHHHNGDVYEIIIGGPELVEVVRYRHGLDTRGEVVNSDDLPFTVQKELYDRVKTFLRTQDDR